MKQFYFGRLLVRMGIALVLPVLLLTILATMGATASGEVAPAPAATREAAPAAGQAVSTTVQTPPWPSPGVYVFLDWRHTNPADYPYVVGGHQMFQWRAIETTAQGVYNWASVDQWLQAEAALGKPTGLRFNSYDGVCCGGSWLPTWFMNQHGEGDGYVTCTYQGQGHIVPKYWSPSYQQAWSSFIHAVGARYGNDPRVAWIEISTGMFGETTPVVSDLDACLTNKGLTSAGWVQTVNAITDIYVNAFPNKPLMLQYAPFYLERPERRAFTDYAGNLGVGITSCWWSTTTR